MLVITLWWECIWSCYSNRIGRKDNKFVFLFIFTSYLSAIFLLLYPTEQLAPNKEAILQIESNEFVPQSFSSSAGSKDQQVWPWIKTRAWLTKQQMFYCLPYSNCFAVLTQSITNFLLTLIFGAQFLWKFVIVYPAKTAILLCSPLWVISGYEIFHSNLQMSLLWNFHSRQRALRNGSFWGLVKVGWKVFEYFLLHTLNQTNLSRFNPWSSSKAKMNPLNWNV